MIAEINNKISQTQANSEDLLTGNFFGSLRYTDIKKTIPCIFESSKFDNDTHKNIFNQSLSTINKSDVTFLFWPKHDGDEIDLIIELNDSVIAIEIKYNSGLSSDDEISNNNVENISASKNQLARYSRMLNNKYPNKKCILLFLARENAANYTYYSVIKRNIIDKNIAFGYLSWQDILESLHNYKPEQSEGIVIEDLKTYLIKKGFNTFKSFSISAEVHGKTGYHFSFQERFSFDTTKKISKESYIYE